MCNKLHLRIRSNSPAGLAHGWIPCGHCYECREALKNSWVFRLRVELEQLCKQGWKIGFFTLTYSDVNLPYIPEILFESKYRPIPCFKKTDVRDFFVKLKKWLLKTYGCRKDTACRYMVCAEFGEHTQRPHYHGIIAFPPNVDAFVLHRKIKELWYHSDFPDVFGFEPNQKGFVYPFDFNGGYDSHGYLHKGFVCNSVKAASLYAAKYVCKDLAWLDKIKGDNFHKVAFKYDTICRINDDCDDKHYSNPLVFIPDYGGKKECVRLSDYTPFHYQSKSLGVSFLDSMSESEKVSALNDGCYFVGDDRKQGLPVYLKNKILFTPKYVFTDDSDLPIHERFLKKHDWIFDKVKGKFVFRKGAGTHRRLVQRECRSFFRENLSEIFRAKCEVVKDKFARLLSPEHWLSLGAPKWVIDEVRNLSLRNLDLVQLASDYLCYYGVQYNECYSIAPSLQWYRRYDYDYVDVTYVPLISITYYQTLTYEITRLLQLSVPYDIEEGAKKLVEQREKNRVNDFFKHAI